MKVTSLKELDSYIYSSVILPLMGLDISPLGYSSPIVNKAGRNVEFLLTMEDVRGDFRHNFQRDAARSRAKQLVLIHVGDHNYQVVADYDLKTKDVRVYAQAFHVVGLGNVLVNKVAEAFRCHSPFRKVVVTDDMRTTSTYIEGDE